MIYNNCLPKHPAYTDLFLWPLKSVSIKNSDSSDFKQFEFTAYEA